MLLPLPESALLSLDLLSEAFPECFLLFLELGVVDPLGLAVARLARLHLLLPVVLIMQLLGHRDEVKHVRPDQQGAEFAEVAVGFVLDWRCATSEREQCDA